MLGLFRRTEGGNTRGHALKSSSSADMSGWVVAHQGRKQGRLFFVLHGALLAIYDDEAAAKSADESHCRGCGTVVDAERWGDSKPPAVSEAVYTKHGPSGFRVTTDEKEHNVQAPSADVASQWVDMLSSAAALAMKSVRNRAETVTARDGGDAEMPSQPELDQQIGKMLELQGMKEAARKNIMLLPDSHKWQLLQSYQQKQVDASGDIRSQPEHWINVLNIEPTIANLQELSVLLRQSSIPWVTGFIELHGTEALCDLLEILEKRTFKDPHDFELMDQVTCAISVGVGACRRCEFGQECGWVNTQCVYACACACVHIRREHVGMCALPSLGSRAQPSSRVRRNHSATDPC